MIRTLVFACFYVVLSGCQSEGNSVPIKEEEKSTKDKKVRVITAEEAAKNYKFKSDHLIGSWLCQWVDEPVAGQSDYIYRFYNDGKFACFYPEKQTVEGFWYVKTQGKEFWLVLETKQSSQTGMNAKSRGLIRVNKKDDFEIHSYISDNVVISDNRLHFTRYIPGTVHELDVIVG